MRALWLLMLLWVEYLKSKGHKFQSNKKELELEEKNNKKCSHHFVYLVKHRKNAPFPEECFLCSRLLEYIELK